MRHGHVAAVVSAVLVLVGCGSVVEAPPGGQPGATGGVAIPADFSVELARTACRGTCPVYQLTVDAGGKVVFRGAENVAEPGSHDATVSRDAVADLVEAVRACDFFNLADCYCQKRVFDMPTSAITVTMNGASHTVRHLKGNDAPPALLALEQKIDLVARSEQWVKGR